MDGVDFNELILFVVFVLVVGVVVVCVGDVVCIGVVVVVFFGVGVEVVVGVFVFVIGVVGLVCFGVCVIGFGFVFMVVCGFFGLIIVCWWVGCVVDGCLVVCVFVVLCDVLLLWIGVIVVGLVGNVELIVILFSCCWFCGWVSVLFRLFCILICCWLFVVIGVCFWVGVEEIGGREIFCWVFFVDVVLGVGCMLFVWLVVLLVRLIFFLLDVVWLLEVVEGVFSVELILMINSSRIRMLMFIIIYWWEVGLLVVFLCLCGWCFMCFLFMVCVIVIWVVKCRLLFVFYRFNVDFKNYVGKYDGYLSKIKYRGWCNESIGLVW